MNNIIKSALRVNLKNLLNPIKGQINLNAISTLKHQREFTRKLWYFSNSYNRTDLIKLNESSNLCSCGCSIRGAHTKGKL